MAAVVNGGIFIANRGEIAVRIARAAQSRGHNAFGVYAPDDATSPHRFAMDACIALKDAAGYSDGATLIAAALRMGARALHPGYGFLSQDPDFARQVVDADLLFVGPDAAAMAQLGDKGRARALAEQLGIATVMGASQLRTAKDIHEAIRRVGFPVLLKAPNLGGGRGLVRVDDEAQVPAALERVQRVAGEDTPLVVERWLEDVRHVEVQIACDTERAIAIGTRDCSTQRRQQKVIEEAPASALPPDTSLRMQQDAARLFCAAKFRGVGTVEFLYAKNDTYFFLEVNPRLQVEHTVTEEIFGIDLVTMQFELAEGARVLSAPLRPRGHAIQARLVAEDPARNFAPETGSILLARWPTGPGIRVDAGVETGSLVGPHYDSLLAKITAWAPTRAQARRRLLVALRETMVLGVQTNKAHLLQLLDADAFVDDALHTQWLQDVVFVPPGPPLALLGQEPQQGHAVVWEGPQRPHPHHASARTMTAADSAFRMPTFSPFLIDDGYGRTCSGS